MHKVFFSSTLKHLALFFLCAMGLLAFGCASSPDEETASQEHRDAITIRDWQRADTDRRNNGQDSDARDRRREYIPAPTPVATPAPSPSSTPEDASWSPLVIRPGSQVSIQVYVAGNIEVEIPEVRVSEAGTVTLPLVGTIRIAGRPLRTVSQIIESLYGNYFVKPQVRMDILRDEDSDSFPWGFVTVLGRVKKQGRVAIPPTRDLTVSSAVQQAGGFDTSARITAIRVTRKLANGESEAIDVNMRNVGRRGKTDEDIILFPNDVVFVPEMMF